MRTALRALTIFSAILCTPVITIAADIPKDVPVTQLLDSARRYLAQGAHNDALNFYDEAIRRDSSNYLSFFQRGAAYLAVGRDAQATADFNKVLDLKPGFEAALVQRAKTKARKANWSSAKEDYVAAGKEGSPELTELEEAQGAAYLAEEAAKNGEWESCITHTGVAILVAGTALPLRQLRARCRFERGEIQEGVSDLAHVLQIDPGHVEPHLQMSSMLFYSLGDTDRGISQVTKCLHSDPDSKPCSRLRRREKQVAKSLKEIDKLMETRKFSNAGRVLTGTKDEPGLLQDIKDDVEEQKAAGNIHPTAPNNLYAVLVEKACEVFRAMKRPQKAEPYCTEALTLFPTSLHGLLAKAQSQMKAEDFDAATSTLKTAQEHHGQSQEVREMLHDAQVRLKQSKSKDYYKILGVDREADERTIKRVYRNLIKQHHPDKAHAKGMTKEEAEKKMASINEAYEVLIDPELRARFDRGDDPNSQEQGSPFQGSPFGGGGGGQQFFFQGGGFPGGFPGGGQHQFKFTQGGGGGGGGFPFGGFGF
ncbi:MAG: hypothetical protein Q9227_001936 [Pyrenula ochraceoflavens]